MSRVRERTTSPDRAHVPDRYPRSGTSARRWVALLAGSTYFLAGCYTYAPVAGAPAPGARIAFDITDAGRVALADRLGPGVSRIEGQVTNTSAEEYAVSVTAVSQINAGRTRWSGEPLRLRRDYVARSEERKLSRGRTALTIGAVVLGIVAAAVTRSLTGSGGNNSGGGGEGPSGES